MEFSSFAWGVTTVSLIVCVFPTSQLIHDGRSTVMLMCVETPSGSFWAGIIFPPSIVYLMALLPMDADDRVIFWGIPLRLNCASAVDDLVKVAFGHSRTRKIAAPIIATPKVAPNPIDKRFSTLLLELL